jgi:hypothetical protein
MNETAASRQSEKDARTVCRQSTMVLLVVVTNLRKAD